MATKLSFSALSLKRGLATVKLVKPSSGDFALKFSADKVSLFSADKRRMCLVHVPVSGPNSDIPSDWKSDEYFIPISKTVLFDTDLDSVTFSITENAVLIQASGGGQTRKATIKRRVDSIRRSVMPNPRWGDLTMVGASQFARLLRMVGCSALVKETKTEEEMRVNQVHFHPESSSASSNSRYHASVAELDGMKLNVSVVGSDIPTIRSFCSKVSDNVGLFHDKNRLYVVDPTTGSALVTNRVAFSSADFSAPTDEFDIRIKLGREKFIDGLEWALAALDGTQRLSCEADGAELRMSNAGEIFNMPVEFLKGSSFRADLPAKFLRVAADHLDSDGVLLKFGHQGHPTLLEMSNAGDDDIRVRHFLHTMRSR
jgi:hypothetical protein